MTKCGYCNRPLTAYLEPHSETGVAFRCEPCQPKLVAVKTPNEWARFMSVEMQVAQKRAAA